MHGWLLLIAKFPPCSQSCQLFAEKEALSEKTIYILFYFLVSFSITLLIYFQSLVVPFIVALILVFLWLMVDQTFISLKQPAEDIRTDK